MVRSLPCAGKSPLGAFCSEKGRKPYGENWGLTNHWGAAVAEEMRVSSNNLSKGSD